MTKLKSIKEFVAPVIIGLIAVTFLAIVFKGIIIPDFNKMEEAKHISINA